ncbi:MBL fold metallo-hydrolase [Paenibacillus sp. NFR01]|uniref:MBL fold metallo-hydrolase n=1 Tax=Paenibacillus sp. NFR01 TaxID=1566279 RepID=UPI0008B52DA2|nr:MBL fold metallo-hydrolase [Paenibacillus sp. NFR01]SET21887.1 L-ascorbate metabolism protein UlaG, beta-lactamase superfamily [Paenibacillus sp. NFR01]
MKIKWYGQSSYLLKSEEGTRVLIDPLGKMLGYKMPRLTADIVIVTHNHRDHNQVHIVDGEYVLVDKAKKYDLKNVAIQGIPTFHDKDGGAKRGNNIVFVIEMDGLRIVHCGDLGHTLSEEQVAAIGPVDILMVPIGGKMTLDGAEAFAVAQQLKPSMVIPMHYWTKALGLLGRFLFEKSDRFLGLVGRHRHERRLIVDSQSLEPEMTAITLDYK